MSQPSLNYFQTIDVAKVQTDLAKFTSIQSAIDAITDNTAAKRYLVRVHPGTYVEKVIMEDYVDLIAVGGRAETVISFVATGHDEPTLTAENAIIKGFTIISDGTTGTFRTRCVTAAVAGFRMEDCVLTPTASAGVTDVALACSASCDVKGCSVDAAGGSVTGALFTTGAQTYNVDQTSFEGATNAIQVTSTPTVVLVDCQVSDNVDQQNGTLNARRCRMEAVALSTTAGTFNAENTTFSAVLSTAGAFAHTISCVNCSFNGQNLTNAATGATTITLRGCDGIATLLNAGVAGTVNLYECGVESVNTSAGTMVAYGGRIQACAASTGTSFVWWLDSNHLKVISGMLVAHALAAAATGDMIELDQGTFAESNLTAKDGVNIVGKGWQLSIIEVAAANPIITVGNGVTCTIRGLKISNTSGGAGSAIKVLPVAGTSTLTLEDCWVVNTGTEDCITVSIGGAGNGVVNARAVDFAGNAAISIVVLTRTAGAGLPSFNSWDCTFTTSGGAANAAIETSAAVVADVGVYRAIFSGCTLAVYSTGANHTIDIEDADFSAAGVELAGNVPVLVLTKCNNIGAFAHSVVCTVTLRECYLSNTYTIGAVVGIVNATRTQFTTFTNGGSGAISFEQCFGTNINNNSTGTMTIEGGNWDTVLQAAAAGTINIYGAVVATELDCGAAGAINAYNCDVADVDANGGTVTIRGGNLRAVSDVTGSVVWWLNQNELKVMASTVNMKIAHALAVAGAGDVIQVGPGTYAESNLTLVTGVNLVGTDPDQCIIAANDGGNAIINSGAVTCTISHLTISNLNAAKPAIALTGNTLTLRRCTVQGTGAGDSIVATAGTINIYDSTIGAGDIDFSTTACNLRMYRCRITTDPLDTAGAVNHVLTFEHCDFGAQNIASAATGGVTLTMRGCTNVGSITNAGTGVIIISLSYTGALTNSSTSTMSIYESSVGAVTQGAAAGTINVYNSQMGDINTGATGTIRLEGGCRFSDIAANAGVLTWKVDPNHIKVVAGTANMKIADALTLAAAGDVIQIMPGTFAESNLTLKASVNLVGTDVDQCLIVANDGVNPILAAAVTCTISNLTIGNTNAAKPAIAITVNTLTLRNCYVYGTAAGDSITMVAGTLAAYDTRIGAGDIDLSTAICTLSMYRCQITTDPIDTGGGFAHVLTIENTDFGGQNLVSAATLVTTLAMRGCTNVGTVSNLGTGTFTIQGSELTGVTANNALAVIRLKNCSYRIITRTLGAIVDESPNPPSYAFKTLKRNWDALVAGGNIATRTAVGGAVTSGGSGQARLRIDNTALDAAGVENAADAVGALDSSWTPGRAPRYCQQISVSAFSAVVTMFFGLRATPGAAVPALAEDHAGFIWTGAAFNASSSDGAGVGQVTALGTPSTGAQHQLEVVILPAAVEFYVDGVLVATHVTVGIPNNTMDFQEYEISATGGAGTSDITLREGFLMECPA